ncbi:leucine-rich repeat flightless-interacting protein 2-like [Stylophora pistillata]|uniref:leucine-rich repeat flightless-interacting protein 2-like n=1 Tax=Stylophora pistillata TaxID=50429 RepID=UPI000C0572AD|nr:leucine-rich repeat flightless-interacting protein 2-like [Stylophora pistillata]
MTHQMKLRGNPIKRSASYNGFSLALPNDIVELNVVDSSPDSSAYFMDWSPVVRKQVGCPLPIRSPNHALDCSVSNRFRDRLQGVENSDVSLTELSDALSGSDVWQEELILRLRRQEAAIEKDKARLEEEIKTLQLKLELEEDLRRNDKECMDILRSHISKLEGKLQSSEKKIRELEHEKQRLEVNSAVLPATKPGEFTLLKARLDASTATIHALEADLKRIKGEKATLEGQGKEYQDMLIKLEHQLRSANKELQRRENRVNELVEERRSLEDFQIKARSLQRKDQKSSYALQIQIVNLQEKLEMSSRTNEELKSEKEKLEAKIKQLENKVKELEGSYRSKLEQTMERLKRQKSHAEDNPFKGINGCLQRDHQPSSSEKSADSQELKQQCNAEVKVSTQRKHICTLLMELNKQMEENTCKEIELAPLESTLKEFLDKISNNVTHALRQTKFQGKPLQLVAAAKEPSKEEVIWEKAPAKVSHFLLLRKLFHVRYFSLTFTNLNILHM